MSKIPTPQELDQQRAEHKARQIESLRNRVIAHLRASADQDEHRVALHDDPDDVVETIVAECTASGWQARRERRAASYGEGMRFKREILDEGADDLVLVRITKAQAGSRDE